MLSATKLTGLETGFLERRLDANPSRNTCERADDGSLRMLENIELRARADERAFFEDVNPLLF